MYCMTLLSRLSIALFRVIWLIFNSALYSLGNSKWRGMNVMWQQIAIFVVGQGISRDVNCDNISEGQKKAQRMSNMIGNLRAEVLTEKYVLCRRVEFKCDGTR